MMDKNILTEGIETLYTIKENLLELKGYQEKSRNLSEEEQMLELEITEKEQRIEDEIQLLIKKRRDEVTQSFQEQFDQIEARIKKVKNKKEKFKDAKVSERVRMETADLAEECVRHHEEIKEIYKINRIPKLFLNRLFFAVYMPHFLKDFLVLAAVLLLVLIALPFGLYNYFLPEHKAWLVVSYLLAIAVSAGIYSLVRKHTKERHTAAFGKIKTIRTKISGIQKQMRTTEKTIRKDQDESRYGLEKFQSEIEELEQQKRDAAKEQKDALVAFESSTKHAVSAGIYQNYEKELTELKQHYDKIHEEEKKTDARVKEFSIEIVKNYEVFVGKELLTLEHIDALIAITASGAAKTINEAILVFRANNANDANSNAAGANKANGVKYPKEMPALPVSELSQEDADTVLEGEILEEETPEYTYEKADTGGLPEESKEESKEEDGL